MGLRSRALLGGIARGFLKSNNDRHDRMEERAAKLAEKQGIMARERAKSAYTAAVQAAQEEEKTWNEYKGKGWIDDKGNFQSAYYQDQTYDKWKESEYKDQEEFINVWKQGRESKLTRSYKSPQVLQKEMASIYNSIDNREREELSRPVLTGFERMMGFGIVKGAQAGASAFNAGAEALGVDARAKAIPMPEAVQGGPQSPQGQPKQTINPNVPQAQQIPTEDDTEGSMGTDGSEEAPKYFSKPQEVMTEFKFIDDSDGMTRAVWVSSDGNIKDVPIGIKKPAPTPDAKIETVSLFSKENNQFSSSPVRYDAATDRVLVNGEWVQKGADWEIMPAEKRIQKIQYPDEVTGVVKEFQAYQTSGNATGPNIITQPDGTKYALLNEGVEVRDNAGNPIKKREPKLPKVIQEGFGKSAKIERTLRLAQEITSDDFISSPTNWVKANLSIVTDVLGASIGLEGDERPQDLEAMLDYVKSEVKDIEGLADKVGSLDAVAIRSGNRAAVENFLTFALARSQYGEGRLTVQSVEMAEKVVSPLFKGTDADRGTMASIISLSQKDLIANASSAVSYAQGQGADSPIWDRFYNVKRKIQSGLKPLAYPEDGEQLVRKIKSLPEEAKAATIRDLEQNYPSGWEKALSQPIRYNLKNNNLNMIMFKEMEDGSIRFGTFRMK